MISGSLRGPLPAEGGTGTGKHSCGYRDARPGACPPPPAHTPHWSQGPAPPRGRVRGNPAPLWALAPGESPVPRAPGMRSELPPWRASPAGCGPRLLQYHHSGANKRPPPWRTPLRARKGREEPLLKGARGYRSRQSAGGRGRARHLVQVRRRNAGPCRSMPSGVLVLRPLKFRECPPGPGVFPQPRRPPLAPGPAHRLRLLLPPPEGAIGR